MLLTQRINDDCSRSAARERSTEAMLDRIADRILTVVDIIGWVGDRLDTADSSTADVLRAITDVFQEQAWMLSARELKT
jgi:DNA-binding ferritin-like protein